MNKRYEHTNVLTVQELIDKLSQIEDRSLRIEVSSGRFDHGGRFVGGLLKVSEIEDHNGKRLHLMGELEG